MRRVGKWKLEYTSGNYSGVYLSFMYYTASDMIFSKFAQQPLFVNRKLMLYYPSKIAVVLFILYTNDGDGPVRRSFEHVHKPLVSLIMLQSTIARCDCAITDKAEFR